MWRYCSLYSIVIVFMGMFDVSPFQRESRRAVILSIGRECCGPWWLNICFAEILVRSVDGVSCFSSYDICICLCVTLLMFIDANREHFNIRWENRSWNNQMHIDCHKPFLISFYQYTNRTLESTILSFSCTHKWLGFYFMFYSPLNFFLTSEVVLGFTLCWFWKHRNLRFVPLFRFEEYFIIRCVVTSLVI